MSIHQRASRLNASLRGFASAVRDPAGARLVKQVRDQRLTFLEPQALMDLRSRAREVDAEGIQGVLIEAGTALGGSAIVMAASKTPTRRLDVYDVFGMIPPPSERDGDDVLTRYQVIKSGEAQGFDGDTYYGYQENLKQKVHGHFTRLGFPPEENNVQFHEGLFEDTLHPDGPVALAHIDGDWYESVKTCLDRIWPHLAPGGVMVIDDYDSWSGCRTAVDEFIAATPECIQEHRARLHLRRAA